MRKDSISKEALEKATLIFSERGLKTVDEYTFSHSPTDYKRGTVEEPEHTSKLKMAFDEFLPDKARNDQFNMLAFRDDQIEQQIEQLQQDMRVSRQRGAFQQLQMQMQQVKDLIKEKEAIDAQMAVQNLGAAQMSVYDDTMDQDDFSEMKEIGNQIAALEAKMVEFRESMKGWTMGVGKPCGASYISAHKVCRIKLSPNVAKALKDTSKQLKTSIRFTIR